MIACISGAVYAVNARLRSGVWVERVDEELMCCVRSLEMAMTRKLDGNRAGRPKRVERAVGPNVSSSSSTNTLYEKQSEKHTRWHSGTEADEYVRSMDGCVDEEKKTGFAPFEPIFRQFGFEALKRRQRGLRPCFGAGLSDADGRQDTIPENSEVAETHAVDVRARYGRVARGLVLQSFQDGRDERSFSGSRRTRDVQAGLRCSSLLCWLSTSDEWCEEGRDKGSLGLSPDDIE